MFSQKTHDLLRRLQLIFAAACSALGVLTATVDLGKAGIIVIAILGAAGAFVSYLADHDSGEYFSTRDIVTKLEPDDTPEEK